MFIQNIPKLKPYVAIKALLTMIIPTDVTTLKNHEPTSRVAFLSALLTGDIFNYSFQFTKLSLCFSTFMRAKISSGVKKPAAVPVSTNHLEKQYRFNTNSL